MNLREIYENRFDADDLRWKAVVWRILWDELLSRWGEPGGTLVDLGAGTCELINAAKARRRIAVDLNPAVTQSAAAGVETHVAPAHQLAFLDDASVDVVLTSNFLEHLADKNGVLAVLHEARRILKPGGRLIAIGPNVRYLPGAYWDYFDHHVPLTDRSLTEALRSIGFEVIHVEPRCLPYTVKSLLPRFEILVRMHLWLRPLSSWLLGKQFLVVARLPAGSP